MITNIKTNKISPHPDNPRKDLGDLTDLTESIKANGILQNLTVVPYIGEITKEPLDGIYRVVIGHRRLAAAKLAGLTDVPCVISNMDPRQQIATMLEENMQRNDLTIYEQAQGFHQLIMDFGETVETIAKRTGLSNSTIRSRVKLMQYDSEKLQKSMIRGGNLSDYAELDKINDEKTKNVLLDKIGTHDFKWNLEKAIQQENQAAKKALLIAELEKVATQIDSQDGFQAVQYFYSYSDYKEPIIDLEEVQEYFFFVGPTYVCLMIKKALTEDAAAKEKAQQQQAQQRNALAEISKRAYQFRQDFIRDYSPVKEHVKQITAFAISVMSKESFYYEKQARFKKLLDKAAKSSPDKILLVAAYCFTDSPNDHCHTWQCKFINNKKLSMLYDFLKKIGYKISDEEHAYLDGTHELYAQDE